MLLKHLTVGPLEVNCYIIGCEKTKEAVVIDPGGNGEEIKSILDQLDLKTRWILLTHGHFDHTGGLKKLKELADGLICIHGDDLFLLERSAESAGMYGFSIDPSPEADRLLKDNDEIPVGQYKIKAFHTPGHSPGSLCYYLEDKIFVGDVLFAGSIGRTDLPGGNHGTLINSIKEKLFTLPGHTVVYPGHGPRTTISRETKENPFF